MSFSRDLYLIFYVGLGGGKWCFEYFFVFIIVVKFVKFIKNMFNIYKLYYDLFVLLEFTHFFVKALLLKKSDHCSGVICLI
ncbi:hypothetical protein DOS84_11800 [Flavobacterium aquariorum]|uniref:Uncharacterized protein n=1 Tax=Flavobacterium aquariorum TaxID=2217670 RepID=A0A2W7UD04_9FLAO|nr:hypothetical protein DOS84_11800 [Flavobacterium aquariorum]